MINLLYTSIRHLIYSDLRTYFIRKYKHLTLLHFQAKLDKVSELVSGRTFGVQWITAVCETLLCKTNCHNSGNQEILSLEFRTSEQSPEYKQVNKLKQLEKILKNVNFDLMFLFWKISQVHWRICSGNCWHFQIRTSRNTKEASERIFNFPPKTSG